MNAKELMVGDWIYAIDSEGNKHPCRANNLQYDYTNKRDDFCVDFYGTNYESEWPDITYDVEPIPLTDEILLKNGFKPQGTGWILEDSIGERVFNLCRISNAYCLLTAGMTLAFQHVHELQHLFRIAGMTREIKL